MGMLASLITSLASGEAVAAVRRARAAATAYLIAGVLVVCGLGFFIGAGYIWAAGRFGPIEAALGFGGGFVLLALLVVLVFKLSSGSRTRKRADRRKSDLAALGVTAGLAVLPSLLRGKGGASLLVGPAIALIAYEIYKENTKSNSDDPPAPDIG